MARPTGVCPPAEPMMPTALQAAAPDSWPAIDHLPPDAAVDLEPRPGWYEPVKAALDLLLALLLLPAALPLVAAGALAVKLTSPGPAFYTQTRLGRNGRPFRIVKLRTMHHNAELKSGVKWARADDDRVFRVGKWLRRTHVDELPQLVNVLLGQMSLVGPRPERPEIVQALGLDRAVPGYRHRLLVKPGVTGLAQVQLPPDSDLMSVRRKVAYDLYYVRRHGPWLDLRLLLATPLKAAGAGPALLRRAFRLPTRGAVAEEFPAGEARRAAADCLLVGVP